MDSLQRIAAIEHCIADGKNIVHLHLLQGGAIAKAGFAQHGAALELHRFQIRAVIEGECANGLDIRPDDHLLDVIGVLLPLGILCIEIQHIAAAGNTQRTFRVQLPAKILAAGAGNRPGHIGAVIFRAHGIALIEIGGDIVFLSGMIREVAAAAQEIFVIHSVCLPGLIPGGIQIIVQTAQSDNVPCMGNTAAVAGNITAVHTQLQRQAVEQHRKALANRLSVNQSGIGRMLQIIILVIQIIIIKGHIGADPIVDALDLFIFRSIPQVQLLQQCSHSLIHFLLLLGRGKILENENIGKVGFLAQFVIIGLKAILPVLALQIIALFGITGVLQRFVPDIGSIEFGIDRESDGNAVHPLHHALAQLSGSFLQSVAHIIDGDNGRICMQLSLQLGRGQNPFIPWIDPLAGYCRRTDGGFQFM